MTTPQEPTPENGNDVEDGASEDSEIADMNVMLQGNIDIFGQQMG